jgi:choline dehydrogenase/4-pyridoxate dehydrogenase
MYFTEPEPTLEGRSIECARGKVIGGSSSINAMAYVRGHRNDYDRWAANGLPEWSYAHALSYFKRQETWEGGANRYRGGDGPLATCRARYADPLVEAYLQAGQDTGYPLNPDYNGDTQEGVGYMQSTIRRGRRCSAADAYLRPALPRKNLTVQTNSHATGLSFSGARATGVQFSGRSGMQAVKARREVIVAGGAINTPQLLMLSGVGDPDELASHGIAVKTPLRGVGKNLRDHFSAAIEYERRRPGPFASNMRLDRVSIALAKAYCLGTGFATDLPSGWTGFIRSEAEKPQPDIQFLFRAAPAVAGPYLPPFKEAFTDGFACRAVLVRPESAGCVRLAAEDPRAPVRIFQRPLAADTDIRALRQGLRVAYEMGTRKSVASFIGQVLSPLSGQTSDQDLDAFIRGTAQTAHHPLGTCRMGSEQDADAVVDGELRVRGIDGLRVVDASVIPDAIGGNINAAVIMIAERASDLIRGRTPLPPAGLA